MNNTLNADIKLSNFREQFYPTNSHHNFNDYTNQPYIVKYFTYNQKHEKMWTKKNRVPINFINSKIDENFLFNDNPSS